MFLRLRLRLRFLLLLFSSSSSSSVHNFNYLAIKILTMMKSDYNGTIHKGEGELKPLTNSAIPEKEEPRITKKRLILVSLGLLDQDNLTVLNLGKIFVLLLIVTCFLRRDNRGTVCFCRFGIHLWITRDKWLNLSTYGYRELATVNLIDLLQSLTFTSSDLSTPITRSLSISINMHIYYVKS